jgi:thioredoxin-like negative regulator of GroEL
VRPDAGRLEALTGVDAVAAVQTRARGKCVLVFHSPRCDFCGSLLQSFEEALPELPAGAVVYTVDIDSNPEVRDAMGIGPVPVVIFLREGQEVRRWRVFRLPWTARRGLRRFFAD